MLIRSHPTRTYSWNATTRALDSISLTGVAASSAKIKRDGEGKDSVWTFPSYSETVLATKRHEPWSQVYNAAAISSGLQRYYAYSDTIAGRIRSVILGGTDSSLMRAFRYSPQGDLSWLRDVLTGLDCSLPPSGVEVDGYTCSPSSNPTRTLGLEYDASRNLRKQVDSISMATDTAVVATGNRLTSWGAKSYTYDADGNMITRTIGGTATTFSYDGEGMLRRTIVGSDTTCYEYNAFNQLVFSGTGCARNYTPGISARNANRIYVWDRDQIIAEVDSFASTRFAEYVYRPGTDRPHALLTDSAGSTLARFFHQDMFGNVIGVTHGTALAQSLEYDPWGELTASTGTLADTSRLRWKGLYWEGGNTKLYHVRNRWYDPEARRFTSEDPIGIEGGMNQYTFAHNDWVNRSDPSGLEPKCYPYFLPPVTVSLVGGGVVEYPGKWTTVCDDWPGVNIPLDPYDEATGFSGGVGDYNRGVVNGLSGGLIGKCDLSSPACQIGFVLGTIGGMFTGGTEYRLAQKLLWKSAHAERHLLTVRVSLEAAQAAIEAQVIGKAAGSHWGWVQVGDVWLQYRAHELSPGVFNIGTIFPVPGLLRR